MEVDKDDSEADDDEGEKDDGEADAVWRSPPCPLCFLYTLEVLFSNLNY